MKFLMNFFLFVVAAGCFVYACSFEKKSEGNSDLMAESPDYADENDLTYEETEPAATYEEPAASEEMAEDPATDVEVSDAGETESPENTYTDAEGNLVYTFVEEKPAFLGGDQEMYKFLSKNLKYPESAIENKAEGTVHVSFVVSKDGSIRDVELAKGLDDASLNDEALRVVGEMPIWTPGQQAGETVNVKYTLPVKFELQN